MNLRSACLALLASFLLVLAGCGPGAPATGSVIVGLTSELRVGVDVVQVRALMRAGGEVISERVLNERNGRLRFPTELAFTDLADGTPIEVALEAFRAGESERPLIVRAAATTVVGGRTLLLRLRLESECVARPGGEACPAELTCVAGACSDPYIDPGLLEPYSPAWRESEPDLCKPAGAGDPIVLVGEGMADYLPLEDLGEAQVEAGPQGGHHIWVAIRLKNLRQSGSITTVTGAVPELGHTISPFKVIFTFDPDEGGFCKLAGLRFQLDGAIDIQELLGKVVDVEVTVDDPEGDIGIGRRKVTLSRTIL